MKRIPLIFLALLFLAACMPKAPTEMSLPPLPTPKTPYEITGTTKSNFMVLIDPASAADRDGLLAIGDYLCNNMAPCRVWFWDDRALASSTYPFSPESEAAMVALYIYDFNNARGELTVYAAENP